MPIKRTGSFSATQRGKKFYHFFVRTRFHTASALSRHFECNAFDKNAVALRAAQGVAARLLCCKNSGAPTQPRRASPLMLCSPARRCRHGAPQAANARSNGHGPWRGRREAGTVWRGVSRCRPKKCLKRWPGYHGMAAPLFRWRAAKPFYGPASKYASIAGMEL